MTPTVPSKRALRAPRRILSRRPITLFAGLLGLGGCFSSSTSTPVDAGHPSLDVEVPPLDGGLAGDTATAEGGDAAEEPSDDASEAGPTACAPSGTPIMHTADITADETWASGVHVVPLSIQVKGGAHLTIAPCSAVQLGPGASITVATTAGSLDAVGTATSPIRFSPQQAGKPWGAISVTSPATAHLAHATLTGGGTGPHDSAPLGGASLAGLSSGAARPVVLRLENVTVDGSGGLGVMLRGARFDPASTGLTIVRSGWYPLYTGIGSATELPDGSYTGNAVDEILLQSFGPAVYDDSGPLVSDVTLHDRGVPYLVATSPGSIIVGDGLSGSPPASLTIEAGVTLLFQPQGPGGRSQLLVRAQPTAAGTYQAQGALIIAGTAAKPVVLDSAATAPAPGDWQGLYFANVVAPQTSIQYAHIAHAGGASGTVGICGSTPTANNGAATCAIIMSLDNPPSAVFVGNSVIDSATCGFYRGWKMSDVDFTANNQLTGISGCKETSIPQPDGSCLPCSP